MILELSKENLDMTVTKLSNGKWKVDISDGLSPLTGERVRHRKYAFRSKKEAESYEADYRIHKLKQVHFKHTLSISDLYALLKEEDENRGNKRGTIDTQESYYKQYVSRFFQDADLAKVTIHHVKEFRSWLSKQPSVKGGNLSNTHVNQQMIFLHKLFEVAIAHQFRSDNPCNNIRKLPDEHKEMSYYTPSEFKRFDNLFEDDEYPFRLLYRMLMYTGIRLGEALALNWNHINLGEGYIDIEYSAYYRNKQVHIGTVKTAQSRRRIYIHKAFVEELKQWKIEQFQLLSEFTDNPSHLQVFQNSPEPLTTPNISNFRVKLKKRMPKDLKLIRNHDFRHSHAAFLVSEGLRKGEGKDYLFFTLMKRLGHSSINTTINIYSHLFPSQQKEVANAFDNF